VSARDPQQSGEVKGGVGAGWGYAQVLDRIESQHETNGDETHADLRGDPVHLGIRCPALRSDQPLRKKWYTGVQNRPGLNTTICTGVAWRTYKDEQANWHDTHARLSHDEPILRLASAVVLLRKVLVDPVLSVRGRRGCDGKPDG
jgi:hypothetical protein